MQRLVNLYLLSEESIWWVPEHVTDIIKFYQVTSRGSGHDLSNLMDNFSHSTGNIMFWAAFHKEEQIVESEIFYRSIEGREYFTT